MEAERRIFDYYPVMRRTESSDLYMTVAMRGSELFVCVCVNVEWAFARFCCEPTVVFFSRLFVKIPHRGNSSGVGAETRGRKRAQWECEQKKVVAWQKNEW